MKYADAHDAFKAADADEIIERAEAKADQQAIKAPQCACVSMDAHECARMRDRVSDPFGDAEDDDSHRRACECECHDDDDGELDDYP